MLPLSKLWLVNDVNDNQKDNKNVKKIDKDTKCCLGCQQFQKTIQNI